MTLKYPRRAFLRTSMLAGLSLASPTIDFARQLQAKPPMRRQKIAVVGAGIAGLVAAYELMQSGHEVAVFEARARPGGRIFTVRDNFADGMHAEGGAIDFGDAYVLLQRYIRLFGLRFSGTEATSKSARPNDVYFLKGKRYVVAAGREPEWPYPLSADDRRLGIAGMWEKYVHRATQDISDPHASGWPDSKERTLDSVTIEEFLAKQGASNGVISTLRMDFLGDDYDHVSGLQDILWHRFFDANNKWMRLKDGNDQLPKAFASRLGRRIHYGTALVKLAQDSDKVYLALRQGNSLTQVETDRVVIAIPFSCLRNVEMDRSFSEGKRLAISKMRYDSAIHIHLQARTRFWQSQGNSGFANTDLAIRNVLDDTDGQMGSRGILGIETSGRNASLASNMTPEKRLAWALENVEKVFPGMAENFEGGTSVDWGQEPWSLGCGAYYGPGEMTTLFPHVGTQEGRVHFAGEHTSTVYVMEGAAQSGLRVANEINGAS